MLAYGQRYVTHAGALSRPRRSERGSWPRVGRLLKYVPGVSSLSTELVLIARRPILGLAEPVLEQQEARESGLQREASHPDRATDCSKILRSEGH